MQCLVSIFGSYRTFRHKFQVYVVYIVGFCWLWHLTTVALFRYCYDILISFLRWYDFSETYEPPLSILSAFVRRKVWAASYRFTQNGGLKFWNSYISQRVIYLFIFFLVDEVANKEKLPDQWKELYQFIRMVIKLTVVIIVGYHCYQLHTKFYPIFYSQD
jgi:hypothetical protein